MCVKPKPSSWQLISYFLSFHHIVHQCPIPEKPTQNATIMSCQMPITGNSAPQCVLDETVTPRRLSTASSLLFHIIFQFIWVFLYLWISVSDLSIYAVFEYIEVLNIGDNNVMTICILSYLRKYNLQKVQCFYINNELHAWILVWNLKSILSAFNSLFWFHNLQLKCLRSLLLHRLSSGAFSATAESCFQQKSSKTWLYIIW